MTKEVTVESFELDHTAVKAPYVRLISEEFGPKGDLITNFDIRLVQPNEDSIPTAGLHTIEHLLAKLIRQRIIETEHFRVERVIGRYHKMINEELPLPLR